MAAVTIDRKGVVAIGKIIILELQDDDSTVFEEIMEILEKHSHAVHKISSPQATISFPGIEIHVKEHKVYRNSQEIHLTTKEYSILLFLMQHPRQVLTYQQIYEHCWGDFAYGNEKSVVGSHIRLIRRKLNLYQDCVIRCVWEIGYCFEPAQL